MVLLHNISGESLTLMVFFVKTQTPHKANVKTIKTDRFFFQLKDKHFKCLSASRRLFTLWHSFFHIYYYD